MRKVHLAVAIAKRPHSHHRLLRAVRNGPAVEGVGVAPAVEGVPEDADRHVKRKARVACVDELGGNSLAVAEGGSKDRAHHVVQGNANIIFF